MDETHADPRITFSRQRRNLIGVSLVLLGFQWAGATFEKITLFGNTIDLSTPLDITTPLWVAWAYCLIRTYQYYRAIPEPRVAAVFIDLRNKAAIQVAKRQAAREILTSLDPPMRSPAPVKLHIEQEGIVGYEALHWVIELRGTATTEERSGSTRGIAQILAPHTVRMPTRKLLECRFRAALSLTAHTPVVTEYVLPFVVAALPVLKWAIGWVNFVLAT